MLRTYFLAVWVCMTAPAQEPTLLVLLKGASALAFYTMEGQLQATVPVGQHPHEMVVSPDGRFAYITDNGTMRIENPGRGGNTVSVVDIAARKRVDTISTGRYRRPHGIAYDARRHYLAVTTEAPDQLLLIDARKRKVIANFDPKGQTAHMVSFAPGKSGSEYAFVSNSGANYLSVVQLTTGMTKTIPSGQRPEGSLVSPDGKELYVSNRESNTITIVDTERQAVINTLPTGKGPVRLGITPNGRTLVYALMHEKAIGFADMETRREKARLHVEGVPISLSVSADGKYAFASAEEQDTVYVIDVTGMKLIRKFQTAKGAGPDPAVLVMPGKE